jgi:flagellar biogenesis protein FliO
MRIHTQRAGVLLDAIVALAFVLLAAFALERLGISFGELVHSARQFFGQ